MSLTSGANPVPDVASPSNKLIYLTKETSTKTDPYTEWIYTGNPTSALDVSKWEVIGETTVDLTQYYTKTEADIAFLPSSTSIPAADGTSITNTSGTLSVANPVPAPGTTTNRGKVLTVSNSDAIEWSNPTSDLPVYTSTEAGKVLAVNTQGNGVEWVAAGGGGSSGSPYTKVSVTPETPVFINKITSEYEDVYNQDININNNTYSVINSAVATLSGSGVCLDKLNIKLPANTEFPMAVVEFELSIDTNATINDILVFVGNTQLKQMYSMPYIENIVNGQQLTSKNGLVQGSRPIPGGGGTETFYAMGLDQGTSYNNYADKYTAYVAYVDGIVYKPKIQVQIFGNCYTVFTENHNIPVVNIYDAD